MAQLQVGGSITIVVPLQGEPDPWIASFIRHDGQNISDKGNRVTIRNDTIMFQNLAEADVGRYNITVSNGAVDRVAIFTLTAPRESLFV